MNAELMEHITTMIFTKFMPYIVVPLFMFSAFLFSDRFIEFLHRTVGRIRTSR